MKIDDFVTSSEAAEIIAARFGVDYSPNTIKKMCQLKNIKGAFKFSRIWLIPREWAETYTPTALKTGISRDKRHRPLKGQK